MPTDASATDRDPPEAPPYAIVAGGRGRSGTNWLLSLLDQSPQTFCRKYPHRCRASPMAAIEPSLSPIAPDEPAIESRWDEAVRWTARRMGRFDHPIHAPKRFIHPIARDIGLPRLISRPRARRMLGLLVPALRQDEWPLPPFLGNRSELHEALPVLKVGRAAPFVLRNRPEAAVFHVVRHPGGFLNSWMKRYLNRHDPAEIAEANRLRLHQVAEHHPEWARRLPPIDRMPVTESELWYWRFVNERIWSLGQGSPGYHQVVYEHLAQDPVPLMRNAYQRCGLRWTAAVERRIRSLCAESRDVAERWKQQLSREQIELVERVLDGSPMQQWWPQKSGQRSVSGA